MRRADSSGTTFVFTSHLSAISEEWKKGPGAGTTVNWPKSDKFVASPKNDGVSATIKQTPGAIGYLEYAFAKFAKLEMAQLQNKAGQFVAPGGEGGAEALASVQAAGRPARVGVRSRGRQGLSDRDLHLDALLQGEQGSRRRRRRCASWSTTASTEGQKMSAQMGYIPLPANVVGAPSRRRPASIQ